MKLYNLYKNMESTILKMFGTGQVTLPKKWRKKFDTLHFKASMDGKKIVLEPIDDYVTLFDANEFNNGEGVEIGTFIKALKKSLKDG
jgi:bifunctional DNA-binding transcriptional regulator/antitoxin component of YhaV-PrlF toxin-antitoxin module